MARLTRRDLKAIMKECLLEILEEENVLGTLRESAASPQVQPQQQMYQQPPPPQQPVYNPAAYEMPYTPSPGGYRPGKYASQAPPLPGSGMSTGHAVEGPNAVLQQARMQQHQQHHVQQHQTRPDVINANPQLQQTVQAVAAQASVGSQGGIFADIFEDTARTTLQEQGRGGDAGGHLITELPPSPEQRAADNAELEQLAGGNIGRWAHAAFAGKR